MFSLTPFFLLKTLEFPFSRTVGRSTPSSLLQSAQLTPIKKEIPAEFSQIFSFRKNSRAFRNFSSSDFVEGKISPPRALRVV